MPLPTEQDPDVAAQDARAALRGRILLNRAVAVVIVLLVASTLYFWFRASRTEQHLLRMTAGDTLSHRHLIAEVLVNEAARHGLTIDLSAGAGSAEALNKLAAGELDAAFVLGDLEFPDSEIREVAVLYSEPLHLFVKSELLDQGLAGLRGKTISLSATGSGTQKIARQLLEFVGMKAGRDFNEADYAHRELLSLPADELPDGIFCITSLPWIEVGQPLVQKHGYRLMELPFAEAMALRDPSLHDMIIPAFSYSVDPPVPAKPLHTLGQRLLIVAGRKTPEATVLRLMKVLFESDFSRRARLPALDPAGVDAARDFPLHDGTVKYLKRNEPLITTDLIDRLENLRSFLMSAVLAVFLFWRWQKRRRLIGFETYIDAVSEVELEALAMERAGEVDFDKLRHLRRRLSEIKGEALERQAEGVLSGEEQMSSFLTHVSDVRSYLESLLARVVPPTQNLRESRISADLRS